MSTIITRNSATSGSTPSSLVQGELAINVTDGRLFYGSGSGNTVKQFGVTSSYALNALSSSYALTASFVQNAVSASYALNGGVTQLLAGPNVTLSPTNGLGQVTVSATLSGSTIFNTATGSYGSFYDTTIQTNPVANIARSMSFNSTDITNGVSISGSTSPFNTYIKTTNAGVYDIQFSAQIDKTDSGTDEIDIWLRKNGIDLTDTATKLTLTGNNTKVVAAWNWFVLSAANDYYQIIWASADTDIRLFAEPLSGIHPGIPSVILTVNRVDQFLSNTGSFSGSFTGVFTGSLQGTSSFATTASYALNALSSSYALSSSFASTVPASGIIGNLSQIATGSVTASVSPTQFTVTSGSITELVVRGTGVTIGNAVTDAHFITGSALITGSLRITGSLTVTAGITGSLLGTSSYAAQALSASFASTASLANSVRVFSTLTPGFYPVTFVSSSANGLLYQYQFSSFYYNPGNDSLNVSNITSSLFGTASFATQALSSSFATTASYVLNGGVGSTFPYTGSALITGSLGITGSLVVTGSGLAGINTTTSTLTDSNQSASIDWNSKRLYDSSTLTSVRWSDRWLLDSSENISINWQGRTLDNSAGSSTVDWDDSILYDSSANSSIDWENRITYDSIGKDSVNWEARQLINTGLVPTVDWENTQLFDGSTIESVNWSQRKLYDSSNTLVLDWEAKTFTGNSNTATSATSATSASFASTASFVNPLNQQVVITGSLRGNVSALSISSNTASLNMSSGNFFTLNLVNGANTHINPTNLQPGQTVNIRVNQDSAGTGTVSFPSTVDQPSGSAYTGSQISNAIDIVTMITFDSSLVFVSSVRNMI
jgi:hypothetical protein